MTFQMVKFFTKNKIFEGKIHLSTQNANEFKRLVRAGEY